MIATLLTIYLAIGAMLALILALGVARAEVCVELLGREIHKALVLGPALAAAMLAWPLVLWMLIVARTERAPAMTEAEMAPLRAVADAHAADEGYVYDPQEGRYVPKPPPALKPAAAAGASRLFKQGDT